MIFPRKGSAFKIPVDENLLLYGFKTLMEFQFSRQIFV